LEESRLQCLVENLEDIEARRRLPRLRLLAVENVVLRQFHEYQARRRFLVLSGPSGLGKTDFVRSLVYDEDIRRQIQQASGVLSDQPGHPASLPAHGGGLGLLEVCAHGDGETLPDIKDLSPLRYGWMLVDEATPELVLRN